MSENESDLHINSEIPAFFSSIPIAWKLDKEKNEVRTSSHENNP